MTKFFERGYFPVTHELFLALFVGFCFLGGILEILFASSILQSTRNLLEFFVIFILLNEFHIFLTPLMLFSTNSGRQYMKEAGHEFGFKRKAVVVSVLCFIVTFVALQYVRGMVMNLILGFIICWSHYHAARQSWGMSCIYRRISGEFSDKSSSWNRWLFAPIGLTHVIFYFILIFKEKPGPEMVNLFSAVSSICVVFYLITPLIREKKLWSWARFYDLRLFAYPMALRGSLLVLAIHGIEYLFISKKFFESEDKKGGLSKLVFGILLGIFIFCVSFRLLAIDLTREPVKEFIGIRWLTSVLVAISLTAKVFHFWVDGYMYTRQYASTRKWILSHIGIRGETGV